MTGSTPVDIGLGNLLIAAALVGVTAALSAWQHLGLTKSVAIGAIRASVQLLIVAVVLEWIFAGDRLDIVLATLLLMVLVAGHTASARVAEPARRRRILGVICTLSIFIGSALTLAYVDLLVIPISPWWNARYLIPLFGMIVANAMNGAALAAERLRSEINGRRAEIEALLALGASASQAAETPVRLALTAAMIPAINALMVVGIVSLPGMMTGQILAGVDPTLAVRYQLVVVFMLTAATAITATLLVLGYRKQFFSDADQLRPIDETR